MVEKEITSIKKTLENSLSDAFSKSSKLKGGESCYKFKFKFSNQIFLPLSPTHFVCALQHFATCSRAFLKLPKKFRTLKHYLCSKSLLPEIRF